MKPINDFLAAIQPLKCNMKAVTLNGMDAIDISEIARNRYRLNVPVMISQTAYQACVLTPSKLHGEDDGKEILWLLKVLAYAKYAVRHAKAKRTKVSFTVSLHDRKTAPAEETLVAQIVPGEKDRIVLLIRKADENMANGLWQLLKDVNSVQVKRLKEAS